MDERATRTAVAIPKRMDRLELGVNERRLHDGR